MNLIVSRMAAARKGVFPVRVIRFTSATALCRKVTAQKSAESEELRRAVTNPPPSFAGII